MFWKAIWRQAESTFDKARVDAGALLFLAADQGDALAVLAQARDHIAVFGFRLVLVLRGLHEAAADQHHRAACQYGVDHRRDDKKPGNVDCIPPTVTSSAPPMVHSTTMKVAADNKAWVTPLTKSTGASVAIRTSSAMRYSGLAWSPRHQVELIVPAVA